MEPFYNLFLKFLDAVRNDGAYFAFNKALRHLVQPILQRRHSQKIFRSFNIEDRFTEIYKLNHWGSSESVSGPGSTIKNTELLRLHLPNIFDTYSVNTVLDAPCGDFRWMRLVLDDSPITYIGGDIVEPLIQELRKHNTNAKTIFEHLDITKDAFPRADLWICRDCLFHLSYRDTFHALERFIESSIPYVLTTTYKNNGNFQNRDINTGSFRFIDLFSSPYFFPPDVLIRFDDYVGKAPPREMCLWSRKQIIQSFAKFARPE